MITKRNVRDRRRNRMKALLNKTYRSAGRPGEPGTSEPQTLPDMQDERWLDPEYVWKQRQRMLQGSYREQNASPMLRSFLIRLIVSALLFAACWALFQTDRPWATRTQEAVRSAMENEFDFQTVEAWYARHFAGFPSFIPVWHSGGREQPSTGVHSPLRQTLRKPVPGRVVQAYSSHMPGVVLEYPASAEVIAIDEGRVIYVGESGQTGLTVIVQHKDGLHSMYGRLATTPLEKDDWLQSGAPVGTAVSSDADTRSGLLYFAMKRGDAYIDPAAAFDFE